MTYQGNRQDKTIVLTLEQLADLLGRAEGASTRNDKLAGAIKLVGCLMSAAMILYSIATYFQPKEANQSQIKNGADDLFSEEKVAQMNHLHDWLDHQFDTSELKDVCFDLGVDFDDLDGIGQDDKARELVEFYARRNRLDRLQQVIVERRPFLTNSLQPA